jgi:hypothetical protein
MRHTLLMQRYGIKPYVDDETAGMVLLVRSSGSE